MNNQSEPQTSPADNPVWSVYNELRTARLNVKYLQAKLRTLKNTNLGYEIVLAIATSSAVAGFSFWQEAAGKAIWAGIGVVATLLSVVKPILNLPATLRRKQELLASYMIFRRILIRPLMRSFDAVATTKCFMNYRPSHSTSHRRNKYAKSTTRTAAAPPAATTTNSSTRASATLGTAASGTTR
jgi:hypothetical protein